MKKIIPLEDGDYYLSPEGYRVFTEQYLLRRGYCCESTCRHCPYGFNKNAVPFYKDTKEVNMQTSIKTFKDQIIEGIPSELPDAKPYDPDLNHAPKRKDILSATEKKLALKNILTY
mgnify:CR=1 FL=1